MAAHWSDRLAALDACDKAMGWARTQPDFATAWAECQRSDWMLWLLDAVQHDAPGLRLFAADCAERALLAEREAGREPDARSWRAVEVARAFARGEASDDELASARVAARTAAGAATWIGAADAAMAPVWAAAGAVWAGAKDAAWEAAWEAAWAAARASVADVARPAVWVATESPAWVSAWNAALAQQANQLRRYVSAEAVATALTGVA